MAWFKRRSEGITTDTRQKKEAPDGLWFKCPKCKHTTTNKDLETNLFVCEGCSYHVRIGSKKYFAFLFDDNKFTELDANLISANPLGFVDTKPYDKRLEAAKLKTGLKDAVRSGFGKMNKQDVVISCMDFEFIGGSMGSVVGEKIARAINYAIEHKMPFLMISKSGGARMMEAGLSLMQMAKTSARLSLLAKAKLPYISLLTDPTTGGVTASFAMLGDLNIAEPDALIGFAGPRVIKETIKKDLPKGFQRSETVLETGFLDMIVDRRELKDKLSELFKIFMAKAN